MEEYHDLIENWIMGNGMAVVEVGYLSSWAKSLGRWHRSKDKKQDQTSNFASYMMNKKWWLEEQFNVHMMRFQQVKKSAPINVKRYWSEILT